MIDIISSEDDFIGVDFKKRSEKEKKFRNYISSKKSIVKKKGIYFDIDYNWFIDRYDKGCELTGIPFYLDLNKEKKNGSYSPYQVSIDRIDPNKGYKKDNCRLILFCLNLFKMQFTDKHMFQISQKLLENQE